MNEKYVIAAICAVLLGWFFRWDVQPIHSDRALVAYMVNRWTGTTLLVTPSGIRELENRPPEGRLIDLDKQ